MNTRVFTVFFYRVGTPFSFNQQYTTITDANFRHCYVPFCAFVGQSLKIKQLYIIQQEDRGTKNRSLFYYYHDRKDERRSVDLKRQNFYMKVSENLIFFRSKRLYSQNPRHHKLQSRAIKNLQAIS